MNESIVADTLKGHAQLTVLGLALHLQTLRRRVKAVHVISLNGSHKTDAEGTGLQTFLVAGDNSLQTSELGLVTLVVRLHLQFDGLGRL